MGATARTGSRSSALATAAMTASMKEAKTWYLYLIRCRDKSLYTGITVDVQRRFEEHQSGSKGKGAKYLWGRGPLKLVFSTPMENQSQALKLEHRVKKLSRQKKEALVSKRVSLDKLLGLEN